jgi:type I restriction enzyme S subunit
MCRPKAAQNRGNPAHLGLGARKAHRLRKAKVVQAGHLRQRLFGSRVFQRAKLRRAREIFEAVSERARPDLPLLAVMQDIGIVRRDELDRRVAMPDGDTSSYKVVRPGDFVISLRSFEGGLEYSSVLGLVSPAYTVLRPRVTLDGGYYRHFFKSRSFIGRLDKLIFGIRDGKQIAFRDFGDMLIPVPAMPVQARQTAAMGTAEQELVLLDREIAALTRQKRGLMQKLLTGNGPFSLIWRLPMSDLKRTAIIYDFDGTLARGNLQETTFIPNIGMSTAEFWAEVKARTKTHDGRNPRLHAPDAGKGA